MSGKSEFRGLPIGDDDFRTLILSGHYYVDKTPFLRKVFKEDSSAVLLLTRPRRFGKTMLLSMFDQFIGTAPDGTRDLDFRAKMFEGLEIMRDQAFVDEFMGQYPTVFISLKGVFGLSFEEAYKKLASMMRTIFIKCAYLQQSSELSNDEKQDLTLFCKKGYLTDWEHHSEELQDSLRTLCSAMAKHFKRQVVLLIDEYDVPLAKASVAGYHDKMVNLISGFFDLLKTTPSGYSAQDTLSNIGDRPLKKVVMTGCLKVAKNSIFTGVNNLSVNTVLSSDGKLSTIIGFEKNEVAKILKDYDMAEYSGMVKENYDGYRFYKDEMFCPWDVLNFIERNYRLKQSGDLNDIKARNYWNGSTSDSSLKGYLGYLSENDNQKMQNLVVGKAIDITVNDSMNYDDLRMHRTEDFWSLLLHTGYLTAIANPEGNLYQVRIPNQEILECFRDNIKASFDDLLTRDGGDLAKDLALSLLKGDVSAADDLLFEMLRHYVSLRDSATKAAPENFYHGMLLGILGTACNKTISQLKSNAEAGDGYADLCFTDLRRHTAVVIELKAGTSQHLTSSAQKALEQIESRNYAREYLEDEMVSTVYAYAIAFSGKNCRIVSKKLKG